MIFSYYPGCTLRTRAKDLDVYARKCALALGVELVEPKDWQCCGVVYPLAGDEIAHRLSAVRVLQDAQSRSVSVLTVCSACHNVLKQCAYDLKNDADFRNKANAYSEFDIPVTGEVDVVHYLEMLRDTVGFDTIKQKVVNPLTGKKIGAYYGCLLLRPGKKMGFDDPENPAIIEEFIKALGAEPVIYPYRNECCGGYVTLENKPLAQKKSQTVLESAKEMGAECVITACPLCLYNLKKNGGDTLPVYYFTELLAEALGVK
ncbi:MAG: CoB--CoM heterodisulfide reductase iron-sulfur subunit B family protein [Clostridia bacterium]|nr:CoB--CoM heterodisulfide reductase iron-sulfur subunit B family protein [Clostridia bacterium]